MLTDLQLLDQVIGEMRQQLSTPLAIGDRLSAIPDSSDPLPPVEIQDPALRFFAEQLKPQPAKSDPSYKSAQSDIIDL